MTSNTFELVPFEMPHKTYHSQVIHQYLLSTILCDIILLAPDHGPRADYGKPQFWHICDSCHPQHSLSANTFASTSGQMRITKRPFSGSQLQSSYITLLLTLRDTNQAPPLHPSTLKHKRWKTMVTKIYLLMQIWKMLEGKKDRIWLQNCWHINRIRDCIHC